LFAITSGIAAVLFALSVIPLEVIRVNHIVCIRLAMRLVALRLHPDGPLCAPRALAVLMIPAPFTAILRGQAITSAPATITERLDRR
jgi:hypothetical protein